MQEDRLHQYIIHPLFPCFSSSVYYPSPVCLFFFISILSIPCLLVFLHQYIIHPLFPCFSSSVCYPSFVCLFFFISILSILCLLLKKVYSPSFVCSKLVGVSSCLFVYAFFIVYCLGDNIGIYQILACFAISFVVKIKESVGLSDQGRVLMPSPA